MTKKVTALQVSTVTKDEALDALATAFSLVFERTINLPTTARTDLLNIMQVLEGEIEQRQDTRLVVMKRIRYFVGGEDT